MTTETNSVLDSVKEAFAPMTEAFKNLQTMEVRQEERQHRQGTRRRRLCRLGEGDRCDRDRRC
jgi:hypothetical protein